MRPRRILKAPVVDTRALETAQALEGFGGLPRGPLAELDGWCMNELRDLAGDTSMNAAGRREALAGVRLKILSIVRRG
jgi:hypothetical protein